MRIAIDARAFSWTGIGTYTRSLLANLGQVATDDEFIVLLRQEDVAQFEELQRSFTHKAFSIQVVDGSYYSWKEQTTFLRQLNKVEADLFHFTHFNMPILFRRPYVVTIHDIIRFIFPGQKQQTLRQQLAYEQVFASAVRNARGIITVSQTIAHDLTTIPVSLPTQTRVIHEGIEQVFYQPVSVETRQRLRMFLGTTDPYLLYVGVWMSHKNLGRLVEAYAEVAERYPRHKLVLTGKPRPGYSNVVQIAKKLGITDNVIFAGFVPAPLLPALYAEAVCFVFPSLYEGFGLPPLEAMAVGTPVVASNVASLPELLGDAAAYANPEYVPGIAQAVKNILADPMLRDNLVAKGRVQAAKYNWRTTAEQHLNFYHEALQG